MGALLKDKNDDRNRINDFFEDRCNHERAETDRIFRNEHKSDLPDERDSHEAIEKSGMGNRRWILLADEIEHKIQRGDKEEAQDGGDPKDNFGEFQVGLPGVGQRK